VSDDAPVNDVPAGGLAPVEPTEASGSDHVEPPTAAKIIAPFVAIGATWAVREVMERAYRRTTGNPPPSASNRDEPLHRALLWAAATAAAMAIVTVAIVRVTAPRRRRS
jgi:hypothetical protein